MKEKLEEILYLLGSRQVQRILYTIGFYAEEGTPFFDIRQEMPQVLPFVRSQVIEQLEADSIDYSRVREIIEGLDSIANRLRRPLLQMEEVLPQRFSGTELEQNQWAFGVLKHFAAAARISANELRQMVADHTKYQVR